MYYFFHRGLEHLPIELQRNFTLMRDLDARAQTVMRNIDKMADEYLQNVKLLSAEKKKEKMSDIQTQFNKAKEFGDDKVQLAIQTYELVIYFKFVNSLMFRYFTVTCQFHSLKVS